MMQLRNVTDSDFKTIASWRRERGLPVIDRGLYPPNGLIIDGIAAGFVTTTDTAVAFIENMITNPNADIEERDLALLAIISALESVAKQQGYRFVVGITESHKIAVLARKRGALLINASMFGKELTDGRG